MSAAKATGSAWKLPPDSASLGLREDQRIVGDAVGLGRQRRRRLAQDVERGAHDLRLAAQTVGILHPFVADEMRGADRGTCHQAAQRSPPHRSGPGDGAAGGCADRTARRSRAPRRSTARRSPARRRGDFPPRTDRPAHRRWRIACRSATPGLPWRPAPAASGRPRPAPRAAGTRRSPTKNSPTPIIVAAMWASGARSPEAPTEPWQGITGVSPLASSASSSRTVSRPHARCALRQAAELERHHQPGDRHRHRPPTRRHATARCSAAAFRDRRRRSGRWPVCRSPC